MASFRPWPYGLLSDVNQDQLWPSEPKAEAFTQWGWNFGINHPADFVGVIASAGMTAYNQFIFKSISAFHEVIQVHVAKLMHLAPLVIGTNKAHLRDENLGFEKIRVLVEAIRIGVTRVRHQWGADFAGYFNPFKLEIPDLWAGKPRNSSLSFIFFSHTTKPNEGSVCVVSTVVIMWSRESVIS